MKMTDYIWHNVYYQLLVLSIREHIDDETKQKIQCLLDHYDERQFYKTAEEHECSSIVFSNLRNSGIKLNSKYWEKRYNEVKNRIDSYFREIADIEKAASAGHLRFILLKNSGITAKYMDDRGKCPMGDIDIIVRRDDFESMHSIIEECGFTLKFRSPGERSSKDYIVKQGSAEYYKDIETGRMWLEMSVRSISGRWIRPDQEPDTELIFHSAIMLTESAAVLNPVENLLQVCLHTAKHSYNRAPGLRLHLDVERIIAYDRINWPEFVNRAECLHVKTPVYFSLLIPGLLFNTPVPAFVLKRLRPCSIRERAIARILAHTGLMHPHEKKFTKCRFILFQFLLYDSMGDIFKLFFPEMSYMERFYNARGTRQLIKAYISRAADIVLRRSYI